MKLFTLIIISVLIYYIYNSSKSGFLNKNVIYTSLTPEIIKKKLDKFEKQNVINDFESIIQVTQNKNTYGTASEEIFYKAINKLSVFKKIDFNNTLQFAADICNEYYILATNKIEQLKSVNDLSNYKNIKIGIELSTELFFFNIMNDNNIYLNDKESRKYYINCIYSINDKQKLISDLNNNKLDCIFFKVKENEKTNINNYKIMDIPNIDKLPKFIYKNFDKTNNNYSFYNKIVLFNSL